MIVEKAVENAAEDIAEPIINIINVVKCVALKAMFEWGAKGISILIISLSNFYIR